MSTGGAGATGDATSGAAGSGATSGAAGAPGPGGSGNGGDGGSAGAAGMSGSGGVSGSGATGGTSGVGGTGGNAAGTGGALGVGGTGGGPLGTGGGLGLGGSSSATGGTASATSGTGGTSGTGAGGAVNCDVDKDGPTSALLCNGDDCDDFDPDVHGGQTAYFSVASKNHGFDYDCSNKLEKQFVALTCPSTLGLGCDVNKVGYLDASAPDGGAPMAFSHGQPGTLSCGVAATMSMPMPRH